MGKNNYIPLIVRKLKKLNPYRIILFGSYASGNPTKDSDIDILVVTNDNFIPRNFEEKMSLKLKVANEIDDIREEIPVDILVYTKPMFEKFIKLNSMFAREILNKGKDLI
jgi:predicted nucleotidyltransferase